LVLTGGAQLGSNIGSAVRAEAAVGYGTRDEALVFCRGKA
jgi:hypothetical protein